MTLGSSLRHVAIITLFSCVAIASAKAQPVDSLGIPGPILFQGQEYALAWSSNPMPNYIKQEYVPLDQSVEAYTDMIMIEVLAGDLTAGQVATIQMQEIEARKASDPVANHQMIRNEANGEFLLDFVISDLSADPIIVEWNAYRYSNLNNGQGVVLLAISRRGYGEESAREFLGQLGTMRSDAINALTNLELPAIAMAR